MVGSIIIRIVNNLWQVLISEISATCRNEPALASGCQMTDDFPTQENPTREEMTDRVEGYAHRYMTQKPNKYYIHIFINVRGTYQRTDTLFSRDLPHKNLRGFGFVFTLGTIIAMVRFPRRYFGTFPTDDSHAGFILSAPHFPLALPRATRTACKSRARCCLIRHNRSFQRGAMTVCDWRLKTKQNFQFARPGPFIAQTRI